MSHVALTGARGFLGWHTRCAALAAGVRSEPISVGAGYSGAEATASLNGASRLLHIAGVNRGEDHQVREGNILFAEQIAAALVRADEPPPVVVYANSTQVGNGSVYAEAKARAGEILADAAGKVGSEFVDITFPNLFGEHGAPFYNSVVATFCHLLSSGGTPTVVDDKELRLLHAQDAADLLLGGPADVDSVESASTVTGLLSTLKRMSDTYAHGEIPDLTSAYERNLFHTYLSFVFELHPTVALSPRADSRGSLVEVVHTHGGASQFSFSTTVPGATRADHFHRRKIERIAPVAGEAVISLRRLFHEDTVVLRVHADDAVAVDTPTLWTHRIHNEGPGDLHLAFWADALLDRDNPDTYAETV